MRPQDPESGDRHVSPNREHRPGQIASISDVRWGVNGTGTFESGIGNVQGIVALSRIDVLICDGVPGLVWLLDLSYSLPLLHPPNQTHDSPAKTLILQTSVCEIPSTKTLHHGDALLSAIISTNMPLLQSGISRIEQWSR